MSTADSDNLDTIEKHMVGFLFGEGDFGQLPSGFSSGGGGGGGKK